MSLDPGGQFAGAERLSDVIVAADFQAQHAIDFLAAGRQEQNRNPPQGRVRPSLRQKSKPSPSGSMTSRMIRSGRSF